ncbi:MAG: Lipopolysaccharide export system ATP-binding protein LptB [Anaerolineales bacterium]|nr:Lipopolysaccharide export system ATP-binding protein LptB [Anaerolineales bacterium]
MALLEVQDLTKRFGGLMANQDIDLHVSPGEILGLIGPNGAGKTTFFNCITGFYPPTQGAVHFLDEEITGWSPERVCQAGIARTFQIVKVLRDMTVLENVMVGAFLRYPRTADARRKALEVLGFTELADVRDQISRNLTIADKKRLELARALATEPKLLFLDEAMAGLNPTETNEAVAMVRRLREQGITMVLVEHVMKVIMPLADRVVVLDSGEVIADDVPAKIATNERVIEAYLGEKYRATD